MSSFNWIKMVLVRSRGSVPAASRGNSCSYHLTSSNSVYNNMTTTATGSYYSSSSRCTLGDASNESRANNNSSSGSSHSNTLAGMSSIIAAATAAATTTATTMTLCDKKINTDDGFRPSNIKSRMTSVGRFSLLSETNQNPSVSVFFMILNGTLSKNDFLQLWKDREMEQKYERFHYKLEQEQVPISSFEKADSQIVEDHIITESLYPQKNVFREDLKCRIKSFMSIPMELQQSLWQVQLSSSYSPFASSSSYFGNMIREQEEKEEAKEEGTKNDKQEDSPLPVNPSESTESLLLFRAHHVLADGVSLGTAFLDLCDEAEEIQKFVTKQVQMYNKRQRKKLATWLGRLQEWLKFYIGSINAILYQLYMVVSTTLMDSNKKHLLAMIKQKYLENLQVEQSKLSLMSTFSSMSSSEDDNATAIASQQQTQTQPEEKEEEPKREVSWCWVAPVDQVKWVAQTLGSDMTNIANSNNITVNDVFVSCICAAIAKQLEHHQQQALLTKESSAVPDEGMVLATSAATDKNRIKALSKFNIAIPVHVTGGILLPGQSLGNRIGAMTARLDGQNDQLSSLERLQNVHKTLYYLKTNTTTPLLAHYLVQGISKVSELLKMPSSHVSYIFQNANCNAMATISNVRGPNQAVHLNGNKVQSVFSFVPIPPGIPMGIVISSYDGKISLSINAEPWIVPNGDEFLKLVLEEYQILLREAQNVKGETKDAE